MSRSRYARQDKPSGAVILLNVVIIILLCAVIAALGLYLYIFYTGNKPEFLSAFSFSSQDGDDAAVIIPSETVSITQMTTEAETTVAVTTVPTETASVSDTAETEPKYTSTEYDKEFYSNSLFIGDSIFTGFSGFGYLQPENVFAQVGLNPESVLSKKIEDVTAVEKASEMQPERICIMLGTNGLAFLGVDYMAKEMDEFVRELQGVCPETQIIILSIPPVTEDHEKDNPEKIPVIEEYNSKLKTVADDNGCLYIDIFTMLQDEDGYLAEDYAEADGLHFLGKAYGTVLSRIQYELTGGDEEQPQETETETVTVTEASTVAVVVPDIADVTVTEVPEEVTSDTETEVSTVEIIV